MPVPLDTETAKKLAELEKDQRGKTEDKYQNYRNAGITLSTLLITFTAGLSYFLLQSNSSDSLISVAKPFIYIHLALIIALCVIYQVLQYGGFRLVALTHFYYLRLITRTIRNETDSDSKDLMDRYSNRSNIYFGGADRIFIVSISVFLGYIINCFLIYIDCGRICYWSIVSVLSLFLGIYLAAELES